MHPFPSSHPYRARLAVAAGLLLGGLAAYAAFLAGVFAADLVGLAVAASTFFAVRGAR